MPGQAVIAFERIGTACAATALRTALAASPLRLLAPRNHGDAAWVFLSNLGGGLVDGDRVQVKVDVGPGASALLGTQASTKVYRSPSGCSQRMQVQVDDDAAIAILPDPVVCFAGARYAQNVDVALAPGGSVALLDGYTCGRSARGERWVFDEYRSRTSVVRAGEAVLIDATWLDPAHGPISERMGRFDVVLTLFAIGPRFRALREAMLAPLPSPAPDDERGVIACSPVRGDGALVRVASTRYRGASRLLQPSFQALAKILGDDPFARKW
ncbi:MAG: urease accessory protein UreD [Myxococcales bacterium]|nr:urease accessory protein UreD [Myxococcales bacterium]